MTTIFCTKCGTKNSTQGEVCTKCGLKLHGNNAKTLSLKIPDQITIDTGFINTLSNYQKMYIGGGLLVIVSSFLPWITAKSPNMTGYTEMSWSIWSLGILNMVILLYLAPLVFLGFLIYKEIIQKQHVSSFLKSLALALFCLVPFSTNLFILILTWQLQSMAGSIPVFGAGFANMAGVNIGIFGGVIGGFLIAWGLLGDIKAQEKQTKTSA